MRFENRHFKLRVSEFDFGLLLDHEKYAFDSHNVICWNKISFYQNITLGKYREEIQRVSQFLLSVKYINGLKDVSASGVILHLFLVDKLQLQWKVSSYPDLIYVI